MAETVTLDGRSLSIDDVIAVARRNVSVTLDPKMLKAVAESRKVVETAVARGQTIYGVNTGFGKLAHVRIPPEPAPPPQPQLVPSHPFRLRHPPNVHCVG